ncbi:S41 family peptidase [Spirosoma pollinicola]|uniref:PDZ domain-containing protein n=1 Tax=Spirosoma pollinicola TaxID=2057025 RepID=A0A2K8Z2Z9_9BACT|nr:S41 family peptidase [Spirosoma pollinicola]AUD04235.1 hypothetical protein CWM47_21765 [Spirosoma pollinicola]
MHQFYQRLPILFLLMAVLLTLSGTAQIITYTPAQVERVAKLSELYGHMKFFHPYLGYKPINWDSAFAVAAPRVALAKTDAETVVAIRQLLAVLNDDATTVTQKEKSTARTFTAADSMKIYLTPDSVLVFKANGYAGAEDYDVPLEKLSSFVDMLPKAKAILLDLRGKELPSNEQIDYFQYGLSYVGVERLLSAEPYATAGSRMRNYSGFVPEGGGGSGGYWSAFYTVSGQIVLPRKSAVNRPLAILSNRNAILSPALFALRTRPHVQFYATEPLSDAQLARTTTFPFSETIDVRFRTGEVVNTDGSLGVTGTLLIPAATNQSGGSADAAEAYVLGQLRTAKTQPMTTPPTTPAALPVTPPPTVYPAGKYPSLGYRLLAGAKIWSVIHYFHAYKDLMPTNWDANLRTAIGELAAASDSTQYALAIAHFYRTIQDGHGFISASPLRYYAGDGGVLIDIQFVENKPVITRVYADSVAAKGIRTGDIITEVNGEKIASRIARMAAIQPASNEWTRLHYVRNRLLRSPVGTPIRLKLLGADGREKTVLLTSQPASQLTTPPDTSAHFRQLAGGIGYVDMGRLQTRDVDRMFDAFKQTKAIIFDVRNYPQGTAWAIAPRLTNKREVVGARFSRYSPNEPDFANGEAAGSVQKYFFDQRLPANTGKSVYTGKTVMLMDERTQSQAEHTGLFFEAANGTEFIGSPTAGANGDVTNFFIPGAISLTFSGQDVRHADGRQLQQVGLQPRILVRPTIKGIRMGKDEVLERAVQYLNTGK